MGITCCATRDTKPSGFNEKVEKAVTKLRDAGLQDTGLIIGIDFTTSNDYNGAISFGGLSLHHIDEDSKMNPYEQVIDSVGRVLWEFNKDKVPAFIFGDAATTDESVRPLTSEKRKSSTTEIKDISTVLKIYREAVEEVEKFGPTTLKPLIEAAIGIQKIRKRFQTLLVILDGTVSHPDENIAIIEEAAKYPLGILVVGVGDGDDGWMAMEQLNEEIHKRGHKNFHFLHYDPTFVPFEFVNNSLEFLPKLYLDCKGKNQI